MVFFFLKWRRDKAVPPIEDCLRVALTTVTMLTGLIAVLGLLLPTPPAPPDVMSESTLRAMGLVVAVALFSYTAKTLHQLFKE
jgi:hypothetical protein